MQDKIAPMVKTRNIDNYTVIEGTKELRGRGYYYDYVIIRPDGALEFGSEEGNYAGGTWLSKRSDNYEERKRKQLDSIRKNDPDFYKLIEKELNHA